MKTLDEVIEYFNVQCKMRHVYLTEDADARFAEALHYLKNYRDTKEWLDLEKRNYAEAVKNCEIAEAKYTQMTLDMNRNLPLTWDELRQMEGKPVWVEADNGQEKFKHWFIIDEFTYSDIPGLQIMWCLYNFRFWEADLGKTWQAYRKERVATGGNLTPEPKSKKIGDDTEIKWSEKNDKELER